MGCLVKALAPRVRVRVARLTKLRLSEAMCTGMGECRAMRPAAISDLLLLARGPIKGK